MVWLLKRACGEVQKEISVRVQGSGFSLYFVSHLVPKLELGNQEERRSTPCSFLAIEN
jgi:hypothetical protein